MVKAVSGTCVLQASSRAASGSNISAACRYEAATCLQGRERLLGELSSTGAATSGGRSQALHCKESRHTEARHRLCSMYGRSSSDCQA